MRRSPSVAVAGVALSLSAACSGGQEARHELVAPPSPSPATTRAMGGTALELLAKKRSAVEAEFKKGTIKRAEMYMGLCAAIMQESTAYGIPNPIQITVPDAAKGGTLNQFGGYSPQTREAIFGSITHISSDMSQSAEIPGGNKELDALYDGPGTGISRINIAASKDGIFHDPLGNLVATVVTVSHGDNLETFAQSKDFQAGCDAAIKQLNMPTPSGNS